MYRITLFLIKINAILRLDLSSQNHGNDRSCLSPDYPKIISLQGGNSFEENK